MTSDYKASLQRAKEMKKEDGGLALTHLRAISAPRAWTWKVAAPTSRELELSDAEYRTAARLNLGLQPIDGAAALPDICPMCDDKRNTIRVDKWHFLSCRTLHKGEINVRHDSVSRALYRCALMMGLPARLEPTGLDPNSDLRPDLLLSLPGRNILTDVAVVHPLAAGKVRKGTSHTVLGSARNEEGVKRKKYKDLAAMRHYQALPFVMETCGGMGRAAERLVDIMAEAGEAHLRVFDCILVRVSPGCCLSRLHKRYQPTNTRNSHSSHSHRSLFTVSSRNRTTSLYPRPQWTSLAVRPLHTMPGLRLALAHIRGRSRPGSRSLPPREHALQSSPYSIN